MKLKLIMKKNSLFLRDEKDFFKNENTLELVRKKSA